MKVVSTMPTEQMLLFTCWSGFICHVILYIITNISEEHDEGEGEDESSKFLW